MERTDIKSLKREELCREMEALGEKKFRADQLYQWMHKKLAGSLEEMTNLSQELRRRLGEQYEYICQ